MGLAGGGIGAIALGILGYVFFGINPLTVIDAVNQISPPTQQAGRVVPAHRPAGFVRCATRIRNKVQYSRTMLVRRSPPLSSLASLLGVI